MSIQGQLTAAYSHPDALDDVLIHQGVHSVQRGCTYAQPMILRYVDLTD